MPEKGHPFLCYVGERYLSICKETQCLGVALSMLREFPEQRESLNRATVGNVALCQGLSVGVALFSALESF